jgi:hypothetical protein
MFYYLITFFIGCITAFSELLSRYNNTRQIFSFFSSWIYLFINGAAAMLTYYFVNKYSNSINLGFLVESDFGKVLISGTTSMAILRSSFVNIKIGNQNIEAGFAAILNVFLNSADREFDQKRSAQDYKKVEAIMRDIDFYKAKIDLPMICLETMKNVPLEEQKLLGDSVSQLSHEECNAKTKSINLGLIVAKTTGMDLLQEVIASNKELFTKDSNDDIDKLNDLINKLK